jgi:predicted RND superfamily exporter protein
VRIDRFFASLVAFQVRRPWVVLAGLALSMAGTLWLASKLDVKTGFDALLPESRPSVQELRRVAARTSGVSTVFVVLEGDDSAALRKAADALVEPLRAVGRPWVGSAESGVQDVVAFLGPRAGLYADKKALESLRDDVNARFEWEVAKATGTLLDESDPPPPIDAASLQKRFGLTEGQLERYPDGYYASKDGKVAVVAIRAGVEATDLEKGIEALRRIDEVVKTVDPKRFHPSIRAGITGDLAIGVAEYKAVNDDLREVGVAGIVAVLGVVLAFYLRLRTLVAMLLTVSVGLAWTFGFSYLAVGTLNLATGFLFTIIAGNGINTPILYMARYLELRREGVPVGDALAQTSQGTWVPTLTAGLTAAASYGSLAVTEFKGFKEFGLIGSVGMVLCWIGTYLALPTILGLLERLLPVQRELPGFFGRVQRATARGIPFGEPFAALVIRFPRAVLSLGVVATLAAGVVTAQHLRREPLEYDLSKMQSDTTGREDQRLIRIAKDVTGYVGLDGMAILVDRLEQVGPLRDRLYAVRDAAPADAKPFDSLHTLQDFVPTEQAAKIPVLLELKKKVLEARKKKAVSDADFAKIERFLPPDELRPLGLDDLPEGLARSFTEADGTRGRIVYISPTKDASLDDARYLFRWADSFRRTELPDGSVILGSGRAVIYADLWAAVLADIPPAVLASFAATVLVVLLAFRGGRSALAVVGALLVGVTWMVGAYSLLDVKLNFINFVALPITFGIGVDYAVNIVQRYAIEGRGSAARAILHTGGAVVLCSLTTTLGYFALVKSMNFAVRSLGVAAVIGEITCLFAAVLVLPAALLLLDRRAGFAPLPPHPPSGSSS